MVCSLFSDTETLWVSTLEVLGQELSTASEHGRGEWANPGINLPSSFKVSQKCGWSWILPPRQQWSPSQAGARMSLPGRGWDGNRGSEKLGWLLLLALGKAVITKGIATDHWDQPALTNSRNESHWALAWLKSVSDFSGKFSWDQFSWSHEDKQP